MGTITQPAPRHPARFSDPVLCVIAGLVPPGCLVLDPFAGTGRIHQLANRCTARTVGIEIEPEWAALAQGTMIGDALTLPFADDAFDVIATSPCYGNRLADHHNARDGSVRHSYRHDLGRQLHSRNAGQLQWGEPYRRFHEAAWAETVRVLCPGGRFVLNISDHIRSGVVQPVSDWHLDTLERLGLSLVGRTKIETRRLRFGANATARVKHETVALLMAPERTAHARPEAVR